MGVGRHNKGRSQGGEGRIITGSGNWKVGHWGTINSVCGHKGKAESQEGKVHTRSNNIR